LLPSEHILLRGDASVPLAPKAYDLLLALVRRHGQLVSRDDLMREIWPDSFVEEINLTVNISLLRKTLGEQPDGRQYIATIPKRGYRFEAAVSEFPQPPESKEAPAAAERPSFSVIQDLEVTTQSGNLRWRYAGLVALAIAMLVAVVLGRHFAMRKLAQDPVPGTAASRLTENSHALDLYNQARSLWSRRSMESVQQSVELFQQAIDADPNFAAAYAGLADAYITAGSYGNSFLPPRVALPKAEDAVSKALALDENSAEAHTSLAYIKLTYDWDWTGAEAEFKRALALNPNYANAHHWYSHELMAEGRVQESHEQSEQALALDPTDRVMNEHMAWHHFMAREYGRAIPQAMKAIELDPDFVQAHRVLGLTYSGRSAEACAEFKKGIDLSHGDPVAQAYLARCYALSHRTGEAHQILDALLKDAQERYISSAEIAAVYAALGDETNCIPWLRKAVDERASALIYINVDPVFDHLRARSDFQAIVKQVSLTPVVDETSK
jgi:DNA-binding winged helix-turn-helix (wHTH) protein/Tfp pilus assembly protein PilF